MHSSPSRGSRWFSLLLGLAAIGTMLGLAVFLRVQGNEDKALPITRAVVARLATEAGARDLYAKNPGLVDAYASADAFVAAVRAGQAAFGAVPARVGREGYQVDSDPQGIRVFVKGTGGTWLALDVERSDGTEAGHAAIGEGITFLGFADGEASAQELRETAEKASSEAAWSRFKAVEEALLTEEGTQSLLQTNPDLAKNEAARTAFLQQARAWRPGLLRSSLPATWAKGVEAPDDVVSLQRHSAPPFTNTVQAGWKPKGGAWLRATWDEGRLVKVTLGD